MKSTTDMLIVSKFHDYYDTAATYGIDKTVVYNRQTQETTLSVNAKMPHPERFQTKKPKGFAELRFFVVGFCGKSFPGAAVTKEASATHEYFRGRRVGA